MLDAHRASSTRDQLGVVEAAEVRPEGLWVRIRFRSNEAAQAVLADIGDGTLRGLSIGYSVADWKETRDGERRIRTATRWTPLEVSIVPVPADPGAHFRHGGNQMETQEQTAERPAETVRQTRAHLTLMMLGQHEATQFRPEMASDTLRQRRHDGATIGCHPTLPPEPDRRRPDHQILDDKVLIALETGAGGHLGRHDTILECDPRQRLLATPTAIARAARASLLRAGLLHAARFARLHPRRTLEAFKPRNLLALLRHGLLQGRNLAQKLQHKSPEISVRKIIKRAKRRLRHRTNDSENRPIEKIPPTNRVNRSHPQPSRRPGFCPCYKRGS